MKKDTKAKGEIAEVGAMLCFLLKGHSVSKTVGDNQRYDFVVDYKGKLQRVQCKAGVIRNGSLVASSGRVVVRGEKYVKLDYTTTDIDLFAIYSPELHRCFVVEVDKAAKSVINLRLELPKAGGNQKTIRWAKDYEIEEA